MDSRLKSLVNLIPYILCGMALGYLMYLLIALFGLVVK